MITYLHEISSLTIRVQGLDHSHLSKLPPPRPSLIAPIYFHFTYKMREMETKSCKANERAKYYPSVWWAQGNGTDSKLHVWEKQ